MNFIDLHVHSTSSDGTVPAGQLLDLISVEQYDHVVLALTDHDCVAGIPALQKAAKAYTNVTIIPGVEVSTEYQGYSVHMLGLGIDPTNSALQEKLNTLSEGRDRRNYKILEKFEEIGIHIPEFVIQPEKGKAIGRPLIAAWLIEQGLATDMGDAFTRYLGEGARCYVDRVRYSPADSVKLILEAGGIPVLAHPMQYHKFSRKMLEQLISDLKDIGMQGIETYYTEFSKAETAYVESLAERFGLLRTGGSDFHGENKPTYQLGFGWGRLGETFEKIQYEEILRRTGLRKQ